MEEMGNHSWQYRVAIHEAAHVAVRYIMFGNIDIVKSVSVGETNRSLGRVTENSASRFNEFEEHFGLLSFNAIGGFAYKECCFSLAGCVADMIFDGLQEIPYGNSDVDFEGLYSFIGMGLHDNEIDGLLEAATPETIKIVRENFPAIRELAAAIFAAPNMTLSKEELNDILPKLFRV